ncbi:MAG TPA: hypothetical protein P5527_04115 [Kiritimatiellia bacterium]|jgi:predicted  nucleic acid-binding Zn-ribbon protein|nr:hypothetical protein [Kiritimatiellia bacterium]
MMEQKNERHDDNRQWFLRINGGTVFGPVATQGLIVWAEQGRILPGHEVSLDRKEWVPAVSVDLLDMRWFVDDGDGELRGPLNRLAAEALIKSGKVSASAQVVAAEDVDMDTEPTGAVPADEKRSRDAMPEEVLRRRILELETIVSEQRERLSKLSDANALATIQHEREELSTLLKEAEAQKEELIRNAEKDAKANERKLEQLRQQIKRLEQQLEEAAATAPQIEALTADLAQADERTKMAEAARAEAEARACTSETEWEEERMRVKTLGQKLEQAEVRVKEAEKALEEAEERVCAGEASLAEVLNDANARDISYQEKIAELEKLCSQPPEETARFYADQAAVYELISVEVAELAAALEREKTQAEQLKNWSTQRQQSLMERRQKLLKHLGGSPGDMTRRTVRELPSDPQVARLRADLENMRVTHQREMRLAETKERELRDKVQLLETEGTRLHSQIVEGEKRVRQIEELEEQLQQRDHDMALERKSREEEREQFEANQRALLARIETLERAAKSGAPEGLQSAEARNVKLASWMRLKN